MSYYEDRIKALEARIEEMATLNRMKALPVEAKLMDRIGELNAENARLKAEVERLTAFTTRTIIPNEELQAQVERLTKQIAGLIVSLQKSHDEHGEALYKLKYKNERKTSRKKRSS